MRRSSKRRSSNSQIGRNPDRINGASVTPEIEVPTLTVLIKRLIATMPGEPMVEFNWTGADDLRPEGNPDGHTNGYQGYFPTVRTASRNGYGAASASTWVAVGAGERILARVGDQGG
jgi:hypothetical protein